MKYLLLLQPKGVDNDYPALKTFTVDLLMRLDRIMDIFPQLISAHSIQVTVGRQLSEELINNFVQRILVQLEMVALQRSE